MTEPDKRRKRDNVVGLEIRELVADHVKASSRPLLAEPLTTSAADPSGVAELGEQDIDMANAFFDRPEVGSGLDDTVVDVQDSFTWRFEETPRIVQAAPANHELFARG